MQSDSASGFVGRVCLGIVHDNPATDARGILLSITDCDVSSVQSRIRLCFSGSIPRPNPRCIPCCEAGCIAVSTEPCILRSIPHSNLPSILPHKHHFLLRRLAISPQFDEIGPIRHRAA
jgi:hypothetical protein